MSDTRRVPGQSVMQRLFRRESVRPMFGPNPAFFQRFGLADPYALGPAWDVESGQDFLTFLSSAAYYQDVYGVVGARSRMLRSCDQRAQRSAVGERIASKGTAALTLRAPMSFPLDDFAEEFEFLEHEESPDDVVYSEEVYSVRRPSSAVPVPVKSMRSSPLSRALMQPATNDEELSQVMRDILVALQSGGDYGGLVDRAEQLAVSNRAVRQALRKIRPAARRSVRLSLDERFTQLPASAVDVAMSRAPSPGQPQRGLRRVLGSSPSVATLEHLSNDLPDTQEPVSEATQRRASQTVRPPQSAALGRVDLPVARVIEEARSQQVSGRAGPVLEPALQRVTRPSPVRVRPTERVALAAAASLGQPKEFDSRRGLRASLPGSVVVDRLANLVSRVDVDDPVSVVPRPAAIRRAVTSGLTGSRRRMIGTIAPDFATLVMPSTSDDVIGEAALAPLRSSKPSLPLTKRVSVRGHSAVQAAAVETSRGVNTQASPVLARLSERSRATETTESSIRPRGIQTRIVPSLSAGSPSDSGGSVQEFPTRASSRPTRRVRASSVAGDVTLKPGFESQEILPPKSLVSSRHALNRLEDAITPSYRSQRRLATSPVSYVVVDMAQEPGVESVQNAPSGRRRVAQQSSERSERVPSSTSMSPSDSRTRASAKTSRTQAYDYVESGNERGAEATLRREQSQSQRVIARQLASTPYSSSVGLVDSPVAYVEPDFVRRSLERRSPAARARLVSASALLASAEAATLTPAEASIGGLATPTVAKNLSPEMRRTSMVARVDEPTLLAPAITDDEVPSAQQEGPTRRWRSVRHAAERGGAPQRGESSPSRSIEKAVRKPVLPAISEEPKAVARGLKRAVARAQEIERRDEDGRLLLSPDVVPVRQKVGFERSIAVDPPTLAARFEREVLESRGAKRDGRVPVLPEYLEVAEESTPQDTVQAIGQSSRASVANRATEARSVPTRGRSRLSSLSPLAPSQPSLLRPDEAAEAPSARRRRRRAATRYAASRLAAAKSSVRPDTVSPAPVSHVRQDLTWLTKAISDYSGAPSNEVSRALVERSTSAVRAALRDRHTVLGTSSPRRVFFDGVGETPTIEARVSQDASGRVVRAVARRLAPSTPATEGGVDVASRTGIGTAPETVILDPASFADTVDPVEWAEIRGRGMPERRGAERLLPGVAPLRRVESAPGLTRSASAATPVFPGGVSEEPSGAARLPRVRQYVTGSPTRSAGLTSTGFGENRVRPSLRAASRDWWSHRPVEHASAGRSLDQSIEYLESDSDREQTGLGADSGPGPREVARGAAGAARRASMTALDVDSYEPGAETPAWALRGRNGSALRESEPGAASAPTGGLLKALARADSPEDVVKVILERGDRLSSLSSELPGPAARLVDRMAQLGRDELESIAAKTAESTSVDAGRRSTHRTAKTRVLQPVKAGNIRNLSAKSSTTSTQGLGAGKVTKLASKLMDLIHLAESERRVRDAQSQVRMAEDTVEARAEGTPSPEKSKEAGKLNIKALQRDVLEAVLRELEMTKLRREDPDGGNIWW